MLLRLLLLWAVPVLVMAQSPATATLAIEHATVLPLDRDTALVDHTVLVTGDRISWIGPASAVRIPSDARRMDARGAYLIPGLADMHVHLENVTDLPAYVAAGVTTVRNMNGHRPNHLVWRDQTAQGALLGPRIFTAAPSVNRNYVRLRSPEEAAEFVREQKRLRYDMIKVHSGISVPVFTRLMEVARAEGIPVVGHVVEGIGRERSLTAGQVSFEHVDLSLFDGDETQIDQGARAIAAAGVFVGTLVSREGRCGSPSAMQRRILVALHRAGVRLLAGTDASLEFRPGTSLHCELSTLVGAGLTPYEALVTATRNAGEFARLHLNERTPFGIVATGARADLVLLGADPRSNISAVTRPVATVLRGVWLPRESGGDQAGNRRR